MLKTLFKSIAELIVREIKVWGVVTQKDIPPEFMITLHAEQRLKDRVNIADKETMQAHMYRAWYSTTSVPEEFKHRKEYQVVSWKGKKEYRIYKKRLYIFDVRVNKYFNVEQKHLITVYDVSNKL